MAPSPKLGQRRYLILLALAERPLHGYGVMKSVGALSAGQVRLGPGTLYGALDRLVEEGLVVVDREEVVDGRLRRYYRLTSAGNELLAAETDQLARLATVARRRLRGARPAVEL